MSDKSYTISEVADVVDVTTRTIRYYVAEELLPPPEGGGRAATYTQEHIDRLKLIKILKDEFLPLQEIRALLSGLSHRAVVELLAEKGQSEPPPLPAPNSAKAYLQTLLHPPHEPEQAATLMRHKVKAQQQGKNFIRPGQRSAEALGDELSPSEARDAVARAALRIHDRHPSNPSSAEVAAGQPVATRWQRIPLTPDVELHIREGVDHNDLGQKIDQLIKFARQLLSQ